MNRRRFLAASVGAVGGAVAVAGCTSSSASNSAQSEDREDAFVSSGIVIPFSSISVVSNDNMFMGPSVTGIAENVSGSAFEYVAVNFSIYNSNDVKIGQAMDNTNGVMAEGKWRFEAFSLGDWEEYAFDTMTCDITAF